MSQQRLEPMASVEYADVLELFSGTDSVGRVMRAAGRSIVSVDNGEEWTRGQPWGQPTHYMDVREFFLHAPEAKFTFGWASVPCPKYSVSVIGKNWTEGHIPKRADVWESVDLLCRTVLYLSQTCEFFLIENPRGKMRRVVEAMFPHLRRYETSMCQWRDGPDQPQKPTDLFGRMPSGFTVKPPCSAGSPCHVPAPRKSYMGTQGKELMDKGVIPENLVRHIHDSIEWPPRTGDVERHDKGPEEPGAVR